MMPTKRTRRTRNRRAEVPADVIELLSDREPANPFVKFTQEEDLRLAWNEAGDEILFEWIEQAPGTRPSAWWRFDAPRQPKGKFPDYYRDGNLPEPHRRLGGIGSAAYEYLAYVPDDYCGIPISWITRAQADYYSPKFVGAPIDPADPPKFGSQAAYLERHGLLLPGEAERLTERDFDPELVAAEPDDGEAPDAA
jgi:hypothetical protein